MGQRQDDNNNNNNDDNNNNNNNIDNDSESDSDSDRSVCHRRRTNPIAFNLLEGDISAVVSDVQPTIIVSIQHNNLKDDNQGYLKKNQNIYL